MQLRFKKQRGDSADGKLRPPPNYFARRVQLRIMMLVGSLMLVFILMHEAAKPQNWSWMWGGQSAIGQRRDIVEREVDTRLRTSDYTSARDDTPPAHQPIVIVPPDDSPLYRAEFDVWSKFWNMLNVDQRALLQHVLRHTQQDSLMSSEDTVEWENLLTTLDKHWTKYLADARLAMAEDRGELTADAKRLWLNVLDEMRDDWTQVLLPTLQALPDGLTPDDSRRQVVARFRGMLDDIMLNLVRDNSVWRVAERDAWFRLFERLKQTSLAELEAKSMGPKGYLQLYDQPKVYRGKLVTVSGTVRLAYHEQARDNSLGIKGYYVFWLRPNGGPKSPIVVYALELPEDFPKVKDRDADRSTTTLDEHVEFTGYFFKRWAYRAKDGINTAPLLVAKVAKWEGADPTASAGGLPSVNLVVIATLLLAALAIAISVLVYFQTKMMTPAHAQRESGTGSVGKQISQMANVETKDHVTKSLERIATDED